MKEMRDILQDLQTTKEDKREWCDEMFATIDTVIKEYDEFCKMEFNQLVPVISAVLYGAQGFEVDDTIDLSDATHPQERQIYTQSCDIAMAIISKFGHRN